MDAAVAAPCCSLRLLGWLQNSAVSSSEGQSVTPASARPLRWRGNVAQCAPSFLAYSWWEVKWSFGGWIWKGYCSFSHFHPDILNISRFPGNNFENICSHSADLAQQTSAVFQILCSIWAWLGFGRLSGKISDDEDCLAQPHCVVFTVPTSERKFSVDA